MNVFVTCKSRKFRRAGYVTVAVLALNSCASSGPFYYLETGQYAEAESEFINELAHEPGNASLLKGLRDARLGIIHGRVSDLYCELERLGHDRSPEAPESSAEGPLSFRRQQRCSKGPRVIYARETDHKDPLDDAIGILAEVRQLQAKWKLPNLSPGLHDQLETGEARLFTLLRFRAAQSLPRYPVRAQVLLSKFGKHFDAPPHREALEELRAQTRIAGQKECEKLLRRFTAKRLYEAMFTTLFCAAFAAHSDTRLGKTSFNSTEEGFGETIGRISVESFSANAGKKVLELLDSALKKTLWHNPNSKRALKVEVRGEFDRQVASAPETQIHSYSQEIPYTRYENRLGYSPGSSNCASDFQGNRLCVNTPGQFYTEAVPVADSYRIPQQLTYQGTRITQAMRITLNASFQIDSRALQVKLQHQSQDSDVEHTQSLPDFGLEPKSARLVRPENWIAEQATKLSLAFQQELEDAWRRSFCVQLAESDKNAIEHVLRCAAQDGEKSPEFVLKWFETNYGLSPGRDFFAFLGIALRDKSGTPE